MSTPRTDEIEYRYANEGGYRHSHMMRDFRQLETELAEAKAKLADKPSTTDKARIAELNTLLDKREKELADAKASLEITHQELQEEMDRATDLGVTRKEYEAMKSQVQELREALKPFAECADLWAGWNDGDGVTTVNSVSYQEFNVGDLRRAKAALEKQEGRV